MFESVLVDQNPHWDGAVYPEGVPRLVLDDVKKHLDLPLSDDQRRRPLHPPNGFLRLSVSVTRRSRII